MPMRVRMLFPRVELIVEEPKWEMLELSVITYSACKAAIKYAKVRSDKCVIAVLACSDARISELNFRFRSVNKPTNVLSWPTISEVAKFPHENQKTHLPHLGDIALAWETCSKEAKEWKRNLEAHASHLIIHACLHLMGFGHKNNIEAKKMQQIEIEALASIGISNPYEQNDLFIVEGG